MNRHYYIGDDLAVLHTVEKALMDQGITRHQVHVLSHDSAGAQQQGLHQVSSLMRNDAVRSAAKASLFITDCQCEPDNDFNSFFG